MVKLISYAVQCVLKGVTAHMFLFCAVVVVTFLTSATEFVVEKKRDLTTMNRAHWYDRICSIGAEEAESIVQELSLVLRMYEGYEGGIVQLSIHQQKILLKRIQTTEAMQAFLITGVEPEVVQGELHLQMSTKALMMRLMNSLVEVQKALLKSIRALLERSATNCFIRERSPKRLEKSLISLKGFHKETNAQLSFLNKLLGVDIQYASVTT